MRKRRPIIIYLAALMTAVLAGLTFPRSETPLIVAAGLSSWGFGGLFLYAILVAIPLTVRKAFVASATAPLVLLLVLLCWPRKVHTDIGLGFVNIDLPMAALWFLPGKFFVQVPADWRVERQEARARRDFDEQDFFAANQTETLHFAGAIPADDGGSFLVFAASSLRGSKLLRVAADGQIERNTWSARRTLKDFRQDGSEGWVALHDGGEEAIFSLDLIGQIWRLGPRDPERQRVVGPQTSVVNKVGAWPGRGFIVDVGGGHAHAFVGYSVHGDEIFRLPTPDVIDQDDVITLVQALPHDRFVAVGLGVQVLFDTTHLLAEIPVTGAFGSKVAFGDGAILQFRSPKNADLSILRDGRLDPATTAVIKAGFPFTELPPEEALTDLGHRWMAAALPTGNVLIGYSVPVHPPTNSSWQIVDWPPGPIEHFQTVEITPSGTILRPTNIF